MTNVSVRFAESETDMAAGKTLCREWLDWHWANYPPDWPRGADHPMDPDGFAAILDRLPQIHQRPLGGILIATVDGTPAGCVMYGEAEDGVAEFNRMGADIKVKGDCAVVRGVSHLSGAPVTGSDLRASAALAIAGLAAKGKTTLYGLHHLDRGYEKFEEKLRNVGARLQRIPLSEAASAAQPTPDTAAISAAAPVTASANN